MRLVEKHEMPEEHFTEGELDLEPPEELALGELDDETMLEEELDNEDLSEEDVDDDVLEVTLEDLVHASDGDDDDPAELVATDDARSEPIITLHTPQPQPAVQGNGSSPAELDYADDLDDLDVADLEDVEEGLDHILAERLAGDADSADDEEPDDESADSELPVVLHPSGDTWTQIPSCGEDEFVCTSCFLVRKRVQLAERSLKLCRDCYS